MWYKIESNTIAIYFSDQMITINPELSVDLIAEIIIPKLHLSYWDLRYVFQNNDYNKLGKVLKEFKYEKLPFFIKESEENIIGCLLQKKGRKNITDTYFIYENKTLFVSKISKSDYLRRKIIKDKVLSGEYLIPKLSELINVRNTAGFQTLFIASIESVFKRFKVEDNDLVLQPEAIDCIAKNTMITKNGFDFFDIEYAPDIVLTKSHFLFRCALGFNKQYVVRAYWPYKSPYQLYHVFCNHFSIQPDVENDIDSEIKFRKSILDDKSLGVSKKEIRRGFYSKTPILLKLFRWLKNKF